MNPKAELPPIILPSIYIEDAAARTMHRIHLNFVKSLQHLKPPGIEEYSADPRIPGFASRQSDIIRLVPGPW